MSSTIFTASPANAVLPGPTILEDGVVFSVVFRNCKTCGLILYHISDGVKTVIPFTSESRFGTLYSVKISPLNPSEYAYLYYRDEQTYVDPYARKLVTLKTEDGEITAAGFFCRPEITPAFSGERSVPVWEDSLIMTMHVKGFTASKTSKVKHRGTFRGITEKIPYLKELGVTAVELMPVYELCPEKPAKTIKQPLPENYWGYAEGYYFAPRASYAGKEDPQEAFACMINALHEAGIRVYIQLYFADTVSVQTRLETARFYATRYSVDGFHLIGNDAGMRGIATDPLLADSAVFYHSFPYEELSREESASLSNGPAALNNLCEYSDNFRDLARCFVKGDDNVLREFVKAFVDVPRGHGRVHYIANYDGFTLNDLVSYNYKHNEENMEENRDGSDRNLSWNCGIEGKSRTKAVLQLRRTQMRNFLSVVFLAQGTPLIYAGDDCMNSQGGNNNAYCQDNEIGWTNWSTSKNAAEMHAFTVKLSAFRKEHPALRRAKPFTWSDLAGTGLPDISFHGKEAWKPDFSAASRSIGILLPEEKQGETSYLYIAMNMNWNREELGVPLLPKGYVWKTVMDTFAEEPFPAEPEALAEQQHVVVRERSIQVLLAVKEEDEKK